MIARLLRFNWIMFVAMLALTGVGTVFIRSAGFARSEAVFHDMWKANLVTAAIGLVVYFVLASVDYRKTLKWGSAPAYVVAILMLAAVLLCGSSVYGGRRWLWFFQPSEVSKLCVIAFVAQLIGGEWRPYGGGFKTFLVVLAVIGVPVLLICAEPDLGTALTLVPAVLAMVLVAKVWRKGLAVCAVAASVSVLALLGAVYEATKPGADEDRGAAILRYVPLRSHQVRRVKTFLFPESDARGDGYTLRQSKISIGSGGYDGKGVGKAESNHLKYLPQSISMNDFIFCVYAEETGFRGSALLLGLFAALLLPGIWIAFRATDGCGRLLALGVTTLVFAHVYVNIAMTIGLMPITGLPLPFMSSGRTFLLTVMAGLGLTQSVSLHRKEIR